MRAHTGPYRLQEGKEAEEKPREKFFFFWFAGEKKFVGNSHCQSRLWSLFQWLWSLISISSHTHAHPALRSFPSLSSHTLHLHHRSSSDPRLLLSMDFWLWNRILFALEFRSRQAVCARERKRFGIRWWGSTGGGGWVSFNSSSDGCDSLVDFLSDRTPPPHPCCKFFRYFHANCSRLFCCCDHRKWRPVFLPSFGKFSFFVIFLNLMCLSVNTSRRVDLCC